VTKVVLGRGTTPAEVVFIGEAPGSSEDVIGLPFQGPAGHLLDSIIKRSLPPEVKYAITNLVGCLPLNENNQKDEPDPDQIKQCRPRLEEFVRIANPRLIVTVGSLADKWTQKGYKDSPKLPDVPIITITHPAAVIRSPQAAQGLMTKKCIVTIAQAWSKVNDSTRTTK